MDLYDDIDAKQRTSQVDGWSSGIKMLQTQLALKQKTTQIASKDAAKKPLMTPAVSLKHKLKIFEQSNVRSTPLAAAIPQRHPSTTTTIINAQPLVPVMENVQNEWDFVDEYNPQWPNEYEKLKQKQQCDKEKSRDRSENDRHRDRDRGGGGGRKRKGRHSNNQNHTSPPMKFSGFSARPSTEEDGYSPPRAGASKSAGAAIAPPPSLQDVSLVSNDNDDGSNVIIPYSASSVAAKIMAKYGFRDGQGLGKQEQGMSVALQVEKTSKRGGRIIHEKDVLMPPPSLSPPAAAIPTPLEAFLAPAAPAQPSNASAAASVECEKSITEIMKEPSKVVLLRNMVGPGDVDEELEPEVKDECNTKYGEVVSVMIHEAFGTTPEDAVKIYVEFKRIESAIKAVVDLNGRFFGGRQVRAGFYNFDKFKSFQLH